MIYFYRTIFFFSNLQLFKPYPLTTTTSQEWIRDNNVDNLEGSHCWKVLARRRVQNNFEGIRHTNEHSEECHHQGENMAQWWHYHEVNVPQKKDERTRRELVKAISNIKGVAGISGKYSLCCTRQQSPLFFIFLGQGGKMRVLLNFAKTHLKFPRNFWENGFWSNKTQVKHFNYSSKRYI